MGIAFTKLGDYEAAADSFRQARRILQQIGDRDAYGQAVAGTAFLQQQQGDTDRAIELYKEAIEIKENIRSQLMVGAFKSSFEERQVDTYEQIIKLLWDRGDKKKAFNYVERARAKTFLDRFPKVQVIQFWKLSSLN
ncbi:MAG: tetratricopeptide repeat protein [Xenococcaceae cyanobacterium MO_188.B32]|nr:tetratricopeptide repeat protein [Xenococcaceae cyanobacterium MO_188.B32]